MEFRILGPLEVADGHELIGIPGTKVRALLGLLLLHPNQVVSTDRLLEGLWGEAPPQTAANTLQTHVSHLRKVLSKHAESGTAEVITRHPGYVLTVDPERIDARRFERLAQEGRRALAGGLAEEALAALSEALSLWRGPALADFGFEPFAASEIGRLEELRMGAVADRIDAELALGRHAELAGELRQLVDQQPLRERFWAQLMLALYRCGRQADALRAFSELRTILGEELGIEPSPDLQRLEEAILLQKPELDWQRTTAVARESGPAAAVRHNLPVQLTSFIGREAELHQIEDQLARARLVTLVGPGGVGKTRLAVAAATRLLQATPDGTFLVELAPLSDPALVAQQALSALGLAEESCPPLETLVEHLGDRRVILVLDNCEHLLSSCALLVDALLQACPNLRILATSREPLRVAGETTIPVAPLPVPEIDGSQRAETVAHSDAVQLFTARARAVRPDFAVSDANAAGVARLCQRLDGMPLALELAAARTRALSPEEIAERLDHRFGLLTAGTSTGPARHQTLRAAVDWTYEALSDVERVLFNRLSVFAGAFTLEDVEDVCSFPPVARPQVLEVLFALVDKSLVLADNQLATTRYRMLETLRHYGAEKLAESGEHDGVCTRLLQWGVALAETAELQLEGPEQGRWLELLELQHDNLRAALEWGLARGDAAPALGLAAALWRFWEVRGYLSEGRRWLERLLALPGDVPPVLRAKALNSAGVLAQRQSAYDEAQALYDASLALRRELGDQRGVAAALHGMGNLAGLQGEHGRGMALFEEALAIGRSVGEPHIVAASLTNLGWLAHEQGDLPSARKLLEEALEVYAELRDGHGTATALHRLGAVMQSEGDWESARSLYKESLRIQRELGERYGVVWSLSALADVSEAEGDAATAQTLLEDVLALSRALGNRYCETITLTRLAGRASSAGDLAGADALFKEAAALAERLGDMRTLARSLRGLAGVAKAEGNMARAARLLGALHSLAADGRDERDGDAADVRDSLGEAGYRSAWMAGRTMDREQALRYALEGH